MTSVKHWIEVQVEPPKRNQLLPHTVDEEEAGDEAAVQ